MIDTVRGVLRVRRWPKKYGKARSALQEYWIDWFRQANLLAKYADGMTQARAIQMTKGSGLYPRDVMLKAMRGRLYVWADTTGWKWYPVAAMQDISESLDVLAQTIGSVLVRAADRWRAAGPATPVVGDALTYQGAGLPPAWAAAGAGVSQQALPGTPIVPDNTVDHYDIDVTGYAEFELSMGNIGMAVSGQARLRFSIDDGVTFKSGASDYWYCIFRHSTAAAGNGVGLGLSGGNGTTGHLGSIRVTNLRTGRGVTIGMTYRSTSDYFLRSAGANFDGPITHIRIETNNGSNFNAGTFRLIGLLAA